MLTAIVTILLSGHLGQPADPVGRSTSMLSGDKDRPASTGKNRKETGVQSNSPILRCLAVRCLKQPVTLPQA